MYINDVAETLPWFVVESSPASPNKHINVLELQALSKAIRVAARGSCHSRQMFLVDSRVVLGAAAKGRSASRALNSILSRLIPVLLGSDFYPGFDFVPTRLNPSDAPSRRVPLRSPRAFPPSWLQDAIEGKLDPLVTLSRAPRQNRKWASWARLILGQAAKFHLLLWTQFAFDATLGFPGEGPPRRATRGTLADLVSRGHTSQVVMRRRQCLVQFSDWLHTFRNMTLAELLQLDARQADAVLAAYGHFCFQVERLF